MGEIPPYINMYSNEILTCQRTWCDCKLDIDGCLNIPICFDDDVNVECATLGSRYHVSGKAYHSICTRVLREREGSKVLINALQ